MEGTCDAAVPGPETARIVETAPENRLQTERAALHEFAGFSGF